MKAFICHILLVVWMLGPARAQMPPGADWHLVRAARGIQVYTAPAGNSGLKYVKVTAVLRGSLEKVQAVFRQIDQQKDWVYKTRKAYLLKQISPNELWYYTETSLPWPLSNRDAVIRMKLEAQGQHQLAITQEGVPSAAPLHTGVVRVPHLEGKWLFRVQREGQLSVEYYLDVDPGGALPAWVVNLFVTKGPFETLVQLQRLITSP